MGLVLNDSTDLTNLGDAIRAKTGDSGLMTVAEMATAVSGIETGGGFPSITEMKCAQLVSTKNYKSGSYISGRDFDLSSYLTINNQIWFVAAWGRWNTNDNNWRQWLFSPLFGFYYCTPTNRSGSIDNSGTARIPGAYCSQYSFIGTRTYTSIPAANSVYGDNQLGVFNIEIASSYCSAYFNFGTGILTISGTTQGNYNACGDTINLYYISKIAE